MILKTLFVGVISLCLFSCDKGPKKEKICNGFYMINSAGKATCIGKLE